MVWFSWIGMAAVWFVRDNWIGKVKNSYLIRGYLCNKVSENPLFMYKLNINRPMSNTDDLQDEKNTIRLEMIDVSTGKTMGVSEMPPEQLPETFEIETVLHLGEVSWSIVEAIPAKSEDFLKTKNLVLKMSRVEEVNPESILFSMSTICNTIPEVSDTKLFESGLCVLRDDDWRQHEFLNPSDKPLIDYEVKEILEILRLNEVEVDGDMRAFDKMHVRQKIANPNLQIDFEKLKTLLTVIDTGNIKLEGEEGFIENGFYLKTANSIFYGILENNLVTSFCVGLFSENTKSEINLLKKEFNLLCMDWINI